MRRHSVLALTACAVPVLITSVVLGIVDNAGGGAGPLQFASATGVRVDDETTAEYRAATASCGPLPSAHFAATAGPGDPQLRLEPVLDLPGASAMAFLPDGRAFVAQLTGAIWAMDPSGRLSDAPVVDLSARTKAVSDAGMLGLAVDPAGEWLYVHHNDERGDGTVRAYPLEDGVPDPSGGTVLMVVDQPSTQHNGGDVRFGPDGYLYVTFGDGGGLGDPFHNSQDLSTVLGSLVRLEPRPGEDPPARPAPGNPWEDGPGDAAWAYLYGTRNPFRFSWDRETGDLWIPDLGQQCVEEINVVPAGSGGGQNLGWSVVEGTRPFLGEVDDVVDHHAPLFEYRHDVGLCAVVGGFVYRGAAVEELRGRYVFTDLCDGAVMTLDPVSLVATRHPTAATSRPVAFAEDPAGELYVLSLEDGVFRLTAG